MAVNHSDNNNHSPEDSGPVDLGSAGNLAKAFIHSPLTPLLLIASLAIGMLGLLITPRQEDPQISVPMVDIFVSYPGASAKQVASLVANPLQRLMSELTGVKHVYSASERGQAMVTVQFEVGEDLESSLVKLYDRLDSNMDKIPPGVSKPMVKPKSVDDVPAITLTLWSSEVDDATLNLIGLDVLQRINEISNTSQSFVVRGRTEQVRIEVLPDKLKGFGISLGQIAQTIAAANSEQGVGKVEAFGGTFNLSTGAFLRTSRDIEQLVITVREGRPVYVRDVAKVSIGPSETDRIVNYYTGAAYSKDHVANGEAAVTIAVAKKKGSNGVTVAADVLKKLEYLKGRVIPDNVVVSITRNYGESAKAKVNALMLKLYVATGAVAVLVLGFLGLRAAIVVIIVIPVVILVTLFSAWLMGYTVDRVSLFALIFSIGILVDDAIVVVENIYRRWLIKGDTDTETAVDAVREVGNPTILATFTVIAALLPMGFVTGMMGPYMQPIPALGSVAMVISLFAAFVFTPWLTMRLKPSLSYLDKAEQKEHRQSEFLGRLYRGMIVPTITKRILGWGVLFTIIGMFFLACLMFYTKHVRVKMLPLDNKSEFNVVINMDEGTALPVTANLTRSLAEELRNVEEVTAIQTYVGTASPYNFNGLVRHYYLRNKSWEADIQVQLQDKHDRHRTSHEIAVVARELLTPIAEQAGARIQIVEMPPGPPVLQAVVAEVYGPNAEVRRQAAADLIGLFEQSPSISDVDSFLQHDYQRWHFEVNREKALRIGVSVDDINKTLEMAMGGYVLGAIKTNSLLEPTMIVLQLPLEVRSQFSRLSQLPVVSSSGVMVPLAELGQFQPAPQDKPIYMKDLRPLEYVTGETVGKFNSPIYAMFEVEDLLKDYTSPDGAVITGNYVGPPVDSHQTAFEWGGEWTVTYETFRDMGIAFGVALILIYMLVVWEFGNFTLPAIVMAPIPLTLVGIVPGHWIMNAEFTATSMIGFIALAGIIVRNSILLIDFAKHEIEKGLGVVDAVINSCQARTRPIVITAFALVGSASVILTDPIFQGMAVSLLFGVLVSTVLTLIVIPLGCISGRKAFGEDVQLYSDPDPGNGPAGGVAKVEFSDSPTDTDVVKPKKQSGIRKFFGGVVNAVYLVGLYLVELVKAIFIGIYDLLATVVAIVKRRTTSKSKSSQQQSVTVSAAAGPPGPEVREEPATASATTEKRSEPSTDNVGGKEQPLSQKNVSTKSSVTIKKDKNQTTPKTRRPKTQTSKKKTASKKTAAGSVQPEKTSTHQEAVKQKSDETQQAQANTAKEEPTKSAPKKGRRGIRIKTDLNGD